MTSSQPSPPSIRVILPDGQELRGRLHARQQFEKGGWMYLVGLPMWADVPETESVEPREYRVWLTPKQALPIDGVSYAEVPTHPLHGEGSSASAADRWSWKAQRVESRGKGYGSWVVHVWDCPEAPAGGEELSVFEALEVMHQRDAVGCSKCGADAALGPLAG
ncbi:DUF6233 domain-containing protein [Streptomyces sp. NPDC056192]|uniref:DUF6233 domain-containing protein n=1 Tax=Streptomyces sp. NPDC056192 TaxID=3345743 RepID=UPI0035DF4F5B